MNWRRIGVFLLLVGLLAVLGTAAVLLIPMKTPDFAPSPVARTTTYAEAAAAWEKLIAATPPSIREDSRPIAMLHGRETERVFVFLHGLSNTPQQFRVLAKMLYDQGYNVVVQRLSYHGEKNRLATEWGGLTAQEMLNSANEAINLAQGLGRRMTVAGLSVNGTVAAWVAQNRTDVDQVVVMAPFLEPSEFPAWAVTGVTRTLLTLPNFFLWWDFQLKENIPGPPQTYPRFPTRVIGEVMLLGIGVIRQSQSQAPACGSILIITTASDIVVNNGVVLAVGENWEKHRPGSVRTYQFRTSDNVPHDFIDPGQTNQRTEIVYPKILELLGQ